MMRILFLLALLLFSSEAFAGPSTGGLAGATVGCAGATLGNTSVKPINNAASASNLLLVSGTASQKVYVCSIDLITAGAVNVALVEGTTTTNPCDTGTAGMAGGATAATGWNFAANAGFTKGGGQGMIYVTATAADNVCLFFSGATQVSGSITYVKQ